MTMAKKRTPETIQDTILTRSDLLARWGCCYITVWRRTQGTPSRRIGPGKRAPLGYELRDIEALERRLGIVR